MKILLHVQLKQFVKLYCIWNKQNMYKEKTHCVF